MSQKIRQGMTEEDSQHWPLVITLVCAHIYKNMHTKITYKKYVI